MHFIFIVELAVLHNNCINMQGKIIPSATGMLKGVYFFRIIWYFFVEFILKKILEKYLKNREKCLPCCTSLRGVGSPVDDIIS